MRTSFQRGMKYSLYLVLIVFLALPVSQVQATSIAITGNNATLNFPNSIKFDLSANSQATIDHVTLIYGTSADFLCAPTSARQDISFTPTGIVYLMWTWDLSLGGILPPGAEIWWQWELHDTSGSTLLTEVKKFTIEDSSQRWQKLQQGNVTVYWGKGDDNFGDFILNETVKSLPRLAAASGINYTGKVRLMVYPSPQEVLDAAPRLPDWIGGVTFPEFGTVMVGIGPREYEWAQSVLPHELAHLVTTRRIFNCQGTDLPTWLSEGLAVFAEGPTLYSDKELVIKTLKQNNLTELVLLKEGFSPDSVTTAQDYAESGMVVTYLINTFGPQMMDKVLGLFQAGTPLDTALIQVYGLDTQGIDDAWRNSLGFGPLPGESSPQVISTPSPFVIPTLALWTAIIPKTANTATPPPSPTVLSPSLTPLVYKITETLLSTPRPANIGSFFPGWAVEISLLASIGLLVTLILIYRLKMRKGG